MKKKFCVWAMAAAATSLLFGAVADRGGGEPEQVAHSIRAGDLFDLTRVLASPEMEGRLAGSPGYLRAARWAAARFKEWGLDPVLADYLQNFEVDYNETGESAFELILPAREGSAQAETRPLAAYRDYCPPLYSGFGEAEGEVVFAGFGITAPELGWDDYGALEARGKIVALVQGVPEVQGKDFSPYLPRQHRLRNAARHGAVGLILIQMPVISGAGVYVEGLPMVMTGEEQVQPLFSGKGYDLRTVRALLRDGRPLAFATGVRARIRTSGVHHSRAQACNVLGLVKGSDPLLWKDPIILGGHLDGIGRWPRLYPGANDNASGSAIILALGRAFAALKKKPKRSIMLALFGAEELGLLGSRHLAQNLPGRLSKPAWMVNFDMNGSGNKLQVSGGRSFPELFTLLEKVNGEYSILETMTASEITAVGGNSDYAPFLEMGIPAYANWVAGGARGGVHSPDDSIYAITPQIMEDVARLYFLAVYGLADR